MPHACSANQQPREGFSPWALTRTPARRARDALRALRRRCSGLTLPEALLCCARSLQPAPPAAVPPLRRSLHGAMRSASQLPLQAAGCRIGCRSHCPCAVSLHPAHVPARRCRSLLPCPSHRTPQAMLPGVPSRWRAADPASTRRASQSAAHLTAPRPPARRRPRAPHPPRRRRRPRSRRSGPAHAPVCAPCCQKPRPTAAPRAAAPARGPRPAQQPQGRVAILNPTLHNCPSASLCALASWTRHRGTRPCLQSGRSASSMSDKHSAPNASAGRGWHGGVQPRRGAPGRPLSWARAGTAGRGAARLAQALNGAYRDAAQDVAQNGHVL